MGAVVRPDSNHQYREAVAGVGYMGQVPTTPNLSNTLHIAASVHCQPSFQLSTQYIPCFINILSQYIQFVLGIGLILIIANGIIFRCMNVVLKLVNKKQTITHCIIDNLNEVLVTFLPCYMLHLAGHKTKMIFTG